MAGFGRSPAPTASPCAISTLFRDALICGFLSTASSTAVLSVRVFGTGVRVGDCCAPISGQHKIVNRTIFRRGIAYGSPLGAGLFERKTARNDIRAYARSAFGLGILGWDFTAEEDGTAEELQRKAQGNRKAETTRPLSLVRPGWSCRKVAGHAHSSRSNRHRILALVWAIQTTHFRASSRDLATSSGSSIRLGKEKACRGPQLQIAEGGMSPLESPRN